MKKRKKHWYFIEYWECPVCGISSQCRIRMFTRKPKLKKNRCEFVAHYDGCMPC